MVINLILLKIIRRWRSAEWHSDTFLQDIHNLVKNMIL